MKSTNLNTLRIPALETIQGAGKKIYAFAIDGKELHSVAAISRLARDEESMLEGYQRPEVLNHITQIRDYIDSDDAMLPNALVVAFNSKAKFNPCDQDTTGISRHGFLEIPIPTNGSEKCGWIVDGQQRAAAIRDARREKFPIFVVSFITDDVEKQREQFILVNSTKPLPKGLIYELLPGTTVQLPTALERKRFPAFLLEQLNHCPESPLFGRIKSPTTPDGTIRDNSILRMLESSINDGALYSYRDTLSGETDIDSMLELLFRFWRAVAGVFPEAWKLPPTKSRLTHGAGIASLGYLMDAIADRFRNNGMPETQDFMDDLAPLVPHCSWTSGFWDFGPGAMRKWNDIQNTSKDINLLADYLMVQYRNLVWNKRSG